MFWFLHEVKRIQFLCTCLTKLPKGKDICLVRQSSFNFLNLPWENWVETVLLLIANLHACCQVLLNMSLHHTTLQVHRKICVWILQAGQAQNKAKLPWWWCMETVPCILMIRFTLHWDIILGVVSTGPEKWSFLTSTLCVAYLGSWLCAHCLG